MPRAARRLRSDSAAISAGTSGGARRSGTQAHAFFQRGGVADARQHVLQQLQRLSCWCTSLTTTAGARRRDRSSTAEATQDRCCMWLLTASESRPPKPTSASTWSRSASSWFKPRRLHIGVVQVGRWVRTGLWRSACPASARGTGARSPPRHRVWHSSARPVRRRAHGSEPRARRQRARTTPASVCRCATAGACRQGQRHG